MSGAVNEKETSIDLLRWGRLCEMATNFVLDKAKFAVECGQFGENFNAA